MDFQSRRDAEGVTGIQLDIKIDGLQPIVRGALEQAKEGRLSILKTMLATFAPRKEISPCALHGHGEDRA